MVSLSHIAEIKRYRRVPQAWWKWWETEGRRDASLLESYKKLLMSPLPDLPNGNPHPVTLEVTSVKIPRHAYTDPLATLYIGTEVLKRRGILDGHMPLSDLTVFIRGDGVVDGWTKVYHLSMLVANAEQPRGPNNCLDFVLGDIEEDNPIQWGIVHDEVRAGLDMVRQRVADTCCVGDGAFLMALERGFTHGATQALNDFSHTGVLHDFCACCSNACCLRRPLQ